VPSVAFVAKTHSIVDGQAILDCVNNYFKPKVAYMVQAGPVLVNNKLQICMGSN